MDDYLVVYSIWCEWDMGFEDGYMTKELAQKVIDDEDWEDLTGRTLKQVQEDGLVHIVELYIIKN